MIGKRAEVTDTISGEGGRIFISGEYWNAVSDEKIEEGRWCEVTDIKGLTMKVRPVQEDKYSA